MADSVFFPVSAAAESPAVAGSRRSAIIRVTHWLTAFCFLALLVSGVEILISHPRFYWGEAGNVLTAPLFKLPIPSSRATVPTGYGYVLPDQNGWSRYLHFQAAWAVVLTGAVYVIFGFLKGHFRKNLLPVRAAASTYSIPQRITYLSVIFVLFPLVIWTGLAMSPGFAAAFPWAVSILGGQQSARTLHFFLSIFISVFFVVHVVMVCVSGFRNRMRGMITGKGLP
jgi:thiosulfate reductase cytochrome b subunit